MYTHQRLAAAAATVAAALLFATPSAAATGSLPTAAPGTTPPPAPLCAEQHLTFKVTAAPTPNILQLRFTNHGPRACTVDRVPTVTFGELDGAARTEPPVGSAPYQVAAGATAYATMRTVLAPPTPGDVRTVRDIVVAAHPDHYGVRITAGALGLPQGVKVYDPVTSLWQSMAPDLGR